MKNFGGADDRKVDQADGNVKLNDVDRRESDPLSKFSKSVLLQLRTRDIRLGQDIPTFGLSHRVQPTGKRQP
jgi:hypothetical protein